MKRQSKCFCMNNSSTQTPEAHETGKNSILTSEQKQDFDDCVILLRILTCKVLDLATSVYGDCGVELDKVADFVDASIDKKTALHNLFGVIEADVCNEL